jgi:ABC-type polar amino acid transport system ATPase subunit
MALLDPPDAGTIRMDELTYQFPIKEEERLEPPWPRLTIVFQNLFLWPHLTLRQNILLPQLLRQKESSDIVMNELIELFEMTSFIDRYPNETSGGQRQRAALARALLLQPSYVLLDEITSALDVQQVGAILKHLKTLKQRIIGILMVTHLIGFARHAADHVLFLDKGEVVESGGPGILDSPSQDQLRRFVSVIESAR